MFDEHVKEAARATQRFYRELGIDYSLEMCEVLFRSSAELWCDADVVAYLEEQAELHFYERGIEI